MRDYRWYLLARVWRTKGAGELLRRGDLKGLPSDVVNRMQRDYDRGTQRAVLRLYRATDARRMVDAPPSVRVTTLPESGHFALADDPERVAHAVVPFLREQVTGTLS
jgi:pimeloyl-ACP methyl ester carboxylesterase